MSDNNNNNNNNNTQDVFRALFTAMRRDDDIRRTVQSGNTSGIVQLLKMYGLAKPTEQDVKDIIELSKTRRTDKQTAKEEQAANDKAELEKSKAREDYKDAVKTIMQLDPTTRLLYNALIGVSEGARALGNASRNSGRMGAQVALEGQRDHSAEQDRIYGPSIRDKANAMYAANSISQGENGGAFWDALSNTLSKVLGMTQQNDLTVRQMQMIPYDKEMNMSGNYYQMMNQDRKRAFNVGRD